MPPKPIQTDKNGIPVYPGRYVEKQSPFTTVNVKLSVHFIERLMQRSGWTLARANDFIKDAIKWGDIKGRHLCHLSYNGWTFICKRRKDVIELITAYNKNTEKERGEK